MIHEALEHLAVPLADLKPLPGNPRKGDVEAVAKSYATFGQRKPIVAKRDGTVIAGNHQLQAAKQLGWETIAVVFTDDDDLTAKAFALADNKTADLGTYDDDALTEIIAELVVDEELLAATGYSDLEVRGLLGETVGLGAQDPDEVPEPPKKAKTVKGDVWLLGPHRIMCGDCREPSDVDTLMAGAKINLAFTSPPYAEQRTYDESSGFKPIPPDEYVEWYLPVSANVAAHLADDGSYFINIKEHCDDGQRVLYVKDLTLAHVRKWSWRFVDEFAWTKPGVPGKWNNRFKNGWEPIFHFTRNNKIKFTPEAVGHVSDAVFAYHPDNSKSVSGSGLLGNEKVGGLKSGVALPGNVIGVRTGSNATSSDHSAAFPVGLPQFFVKAYTDQGDVVYDPFMGSGSTLLAAHNEGRIGFGMELSPAYVDVICKRFQQATGIVPINETTKREHSFLD